MQEFLFIIYFKTITDEDQNFGTIKLKVVILKFI